MKTARKTTYLPAPKSPSAGELDARILNLIARGVEHRCPDAGFDSLALALFRHQFALNRPYRRYCESLSRSPRNVAHWKQIPAIPTTAFKNANLTTLTPKQRTTVFHSSGTTEHRPSRHFHNAATLALYEAALWPMFAGRVTSGEWRTARNCQLVILTPTLAEAPHSSLVHMMETVRRRRQAPPSVFVGAAALENGRALATAVQSKIQNPKSKVLLLGTAFAFVRLFDAITTAPRQGRGLQLPPGSRVMETGGYKGRTREVPRKELHALISAKLGVPRTAIVSEYGMCELSSQFYAASQSAVFHGPPWTRVRLINPETDREAREGERGLIRIFDLANRASVIAIQTEDIGVRRGDGFELLGRAPQAEARGCSLMVPL
ncbi:MAG: long-chain fatty acid--CoA ligase [Verrucomicrobia bacterium]|nr:long-chain fatty acid--CoA ligase [Verrucomicrobiota bacterium]